MLEAAFERDGKQLRLREVPQIRIHWRGAASWRLHATVDIVGASALPEFATRRYRDTVVLLRQLSVSFEQLHQCREAKTLQPLEATKGPRGVIGMLSFRKCRPHLANSPDSFLSKAPNGRIRVPPTVT